MPEEKKDTPVIPLVPASAVPASTPETPKETLIEIPKSVNFCTKSVGYTEMERKGQLGDSDIGMRYIHGEIPVTVWQLGIELSGDKDYWRHDNYRKVKQWLNQHSYWKN